MNSNKSFLFIVSIIALVVFLFIGCSNNKQMDANDTISSTEINVIDNEELDSEITTNNKSDAITIEEEDEQMIESGLSDNTLTSTTQAHSSGNSQGSSSYNTNENEPTSPNTTSYRSGSEQNGEWGKSIKN